MGKLREALADCNKSISMVGEICTHAHKLRGEIHFTMKMYKYAISDFKTVLAKQDDEGILLLAYT